jgi:hypothetical protein
MNSGTLAPFPITANLLLEIFDSPVSFHRCLVPITGSVTAALMLSQAIWASQAVAPEANGWFIKSQDSWTEETGLSRWEQQTARRMLRDAGFIEERRVGIPAKLYYRVRSEQVLRALHAHAGAIHGEHPKEHA